jgi:AbrB family looped-hinge helix DNA binding protein
MTTVPLSPKYQIVIPKEIRKQCDLKPGQKLQVLHKNGEIVLKPILTGSQLIGILENFRHVPFERDEDRNV